MYRQHATTMYVYGWICSIITSFIQILVSTSSQLALRPSFKSVIWLGFRENTQKFNKKRDLGVKITYLTTFPKILH